MPSLQAQVLLIARAQRALLGVTLASLATFYFAAYRPATARLAELQSITRAHEQEFRTNQAKASARNEIAARNEKLRQELDQIKKPSKQQELPDLIKELTRFGQQCSLRKFNYKPGAPVSSELFCELPISLSIEGDFVNIFGFIRSTEEMQRLTRVRSVSIKSRDDQSGSVQAEVVVNIYFSTE